MPLYVFRCAEHREPITRIVSIEERDKQVCLVQIKQVAGPHLIGADPTAEPRTWVRTCNLPLEREEIAETAFVPSSWKP